MTLVLDEKVIKSLPITLDPDRVSGTPVFTGTRVPVDALITNLEAGLELALAKERAKSSLLIVLICREGARQPSVLHNHK